MSLEQQVRVIALKETILEDNDSDAALLRGDLSRKGIFLLNLMSSPGSGKTSTLIALAKAFSSRLSMGVMEADIDSDVDAKKLLDNGIPSIQLHTGGMCHLDADMTRQGILAFGREDLDLIVLENIGNLVCPAEFDTGAHINATILSVPEGEDKPLKYPLMYQKSDILIINKVDTLPLFDFSVEKAAGFAKRQNPDIAVFPICAKSGEGVDALAEYLFDMIKEGNSRV